MNLPKARALYEDIDDSPSQVAMQKALRANADEIARLAEALRAAEAERDNALAALAGTKALNRTCAEERNSLRAQLVAAHRTPSEADPDIRLLRMPLSTQKVAIIADPAQAHAKELVETLSRQFDVLAVESRADAMRMSDGWASTHASGRASAFEKAHIMTHALLATLDAERNSQKGNPQ